MQQLRTTIAVALFCSFFASTTLANAQEPPRMSQHGTVSQTITGTTITVEYDRPTARGRDLKGQDIIHFGRFWTPGANWATTVEVDGSFKVEGHELGAGKYSIWMIPGDDEWTVVFSEDDRVFHTRTPDQNKEAARFTVASVEGPEMDALTFYFPEVTGHRTTLNFHWGHFVVPIRFEVSPWPMAALTDEDLARYVGSYTDPRGNAVTVTNVGGVLEISGLSFLGGDSSQLIPKGHHTFNFGNVIDGELRGIWLPRFELAFVMENGDVSAIEMWGSGILRQTIPRN